jgi:hypothetical protein
MPSQPASRIFHRLEPLAVAAIGLGLAEELVLGLVEVDLEAQGLRHEWRAEISKKIAATRRWCC